MADDDHAARLGATVVREGQVGVPFFVRRPVQGAVERVFRNQRQGVAVRVFRFLHIGEIVAPFQRAVQRNSDVALEAGHDGGGAVFPLQDVGVGRNDADERAADDELVAVGVVEIRHAGRPAVVRKFKTQLFVERGFGFQVGVAQIIARAGGGEAGHNRTAFAARGNQVARVRLVQAGGFVGARDAALDAPVRADALLEVQAAAHVAAGNAAVVVAQEGNQVGLLPRRPVVFGKDRPAVFHHVAVVRPAAGYRVARAAPGVAHGVGVVQRAAPQFRACGQNMAARRVERNVEFGAQARVFQAAVGEFVAAVAAFGPARHVVGEAAVFGFVITEPGFVLAPAKRAVVGQRVGTAVQTRGFFHAVAQQLRCDTGIVAVERVAVVDVALAAEAAVQR